MAGVSSPFEMRALDATPTKTPPSGTLLLYAKADGKIYVKNSAGTEAQVGGGGGSSVVPIQNEAPTGTPDGTLWWDADDDVSAGVATVNGKTGQDITLVPADIGAAPAAHNHSGADITSGTVPQAHLKPNITRVLHDGLNYPARPTGVTYVEWVGPTEPTNGINGDTWVKTA